MTNLPPPSFGGPPPGGGPFVAVPPPRPPRSTRGPKVLTLIGLLCTVIGWGAFIGGFIVTGVKLFEDVDAGLDPAGELDVIVDAPGEGSVVLEQGERYQVVVLGHGLTTTSGNSSDAGGLHVDRTAFAEPDLTVTAPDGSEVPLDPPGHERLVSGPTDAVGIRELTAPVDGTYTLTVTSGGDGPVEQVGIGEAKGLFDDVGTYVGASIVIALGALVGTVGIFLFVGGGIWWIVASSSRS